MANANANAEVGGVKELVWSQLRAARDALIWKLDGLSEYDLRRPMTRTGTNLLGVMKHLAGEEYGYLGEVFARPAPEQLACVTDGTLRNYGDMWATPDESADYIKGFYRRACAHADETIGALDLDAAGSVPWWGEHDRQTTLGAILLLMLSETQRHGGHVDIVRELIDGSAGGQNATGTHEVPDEQWSEEYVAQLEAAARAGAERWRE
jgi:hypothetical protein